MPLHLIAECCKCHNTISRDLWAIKKNHGYSERLYICNHFDIEINHESSTGFFGWGWRNIIKITAYYKPDSCSKEIINQIFSISNTEYQNYEVFGDKTVFHARISDFRNNYPIIGRNLQNDIEYNEMREHEALELLRREQQRKEKLLKLF